MNAQYIIINFKPIWNKQDEQKQWRNYKSITERMQEQRTRNLIQQEQLGPGAHVLRMVQEAPRRNLVRRNQLRT